GKSLEAVYGIDIDSFQKLSNGFVFVEGGPFTGPDDIIVDDIAAASSHLHVGDTLEVLNHKFKVCGVVQNGKGARKYMPIATVQDLIGSPNKASIFYIKLDDPKNADAFVASVKTHPGMEQYNTQSITEFLSLLTPDSLPGFSIFIKVVIGVSVCIGFIVIFQSMYTAVMERTREIGILKSMGASKAY